MEQNWDILVGEASTDARLPPRAPRRTADGVFFRPLLPAGAAAVELEPAAAAPPERLANDDDDSGAAVGGLGI